MYIGRFSNRTGDFSNSKPCAHCLSMLKKYGIRKVAYTTDSGVVKTKTSSLNTSHQSTAFRKFSKYCKV